MKLDGIIYHTQNQFKMIEDVKVRPEIIKLLEENIISKFFNTGLSCDFLTQKSESNKSKNK